MSQTAGERANAARELARRLYTSANITATMTVADFTAAIGSIDDTMDALPAALTAGSTIKQNFLARLPEPFKSTATTQQKAIALMIWAFQETGLL